MLVYILLYIYRWCWTYICILKNKDLETRTREKHEKNTFCCSSFLYYTEEFQTVILLFFRTDRWWVYYYAWSSTLCSFLSLLFSPFLGFFFLSSMFLILTWIMNCWFSCSFFPSLSQLYIRYINDILYDVFCFFLSLSSFSLFSLSLFYSFVCIFVSVVFVVLYIYKIKSSNSCSL